MAAINAKPKSTLSRGLEPSKHTIREVSLPAKIPTDELLDDLERVADEMGATPTKEEYQTYGEFHPATFEKRFGSWNDAVGELGLPANKPTPSDWDRVSRAELKTALKELASELGRAPSGNEMDDQGEFSRSTYVRRFGSWNNALEETGFGPHSLSFKSYHNRIPCRELVDTFTDLLCDLGRVPTRDEMENQGGYSTRAYQNCFGSWGETVRALGVSPSYFPDRAQERVAELSGKSKSISYVELVNEIHFLKAVLGRTPRVTDMREFGAYGTSSYRRRFGGWNPTLRAAGLEPNHPVDVTNDQLRAELRRLRDQQGQTPSYTDMEREGAFSGAVYEIRFGSWAAALREIGEEPNWPLYGDENPAWAGGHQPCYGPNWETQRAKTLERDGYQCQDPRCGVDDETHREQYGCSLIVHHITPLHNFIDGGELNHESANRLDNLVTLCLACHPTWEQLSPLRPQPAPGD